MTEKIKKFKFKKNQKVHLDELYYISHQYESDDIFYTKNDLDDEKICLKNIEITIKIKD